MKRNWIVIIISIIYFLLIILSLFFALTGNLSKIVGQEVPQWYYYFIYFLSIVYLIGFVFCRSGGGWIFYLFDFHKILIKQIVNYHPQSGWHELAP